MDYDWNGTRTRRIKKLKLSVVALLSAAFALALASWQHLIR
jgi:hypothetical protein